MVAHSASLGLTEEDIERIHAAYLSLVDVQDGEECGVVNAKKLKGAVMFLNQDEIDAIVTGQIRSYIDAAEHSMRDPMQLKVARVGAGPADENGMIVEALEEEEGQPRMSIRSQLEEEGLELLAEKRIDAEEESGLTDTGKIRANLNNHQE